jgi:hypothetical protein
MNNEIENTTDASRNMDAQFNRLPFFIRADQWPNVRLTLRAERLRPAAQLMQNKVADRRAEVRSSAGIDRRHR